MSTTSLNFGKAHLSGMLGTLRFNLLPLPNRRHHHRLRHHPPLHRLIPFRLGP